MKKGEIRSTMGFNMFIDRETFRGLNALLNVWYACKDTHEFDEVKQHALFPTISAAVDSISDHIAQPSHDMGWCEDPNCPHNHE